MTTGCCGAGTAGTFRRPGETACRRGCPGAIGGQIVIVEAGTGRLLGSVGVGQAPAAAHPGAVYLHQGETYVVDSLDFQDGIAFVHAEDPGYATFAREVTDIAVTGTGERLVFGPVALGLVPVTVTNHVVGYLRRQLSGRCWTSWSWTCRNTPCPQPRSCTQSLRMHWSAAVLRPHGFPGRCTPPNTRPSGCCRWWPAATAAISAACPQRPGPRAAQCLCLRRLSGWSRIRRTRLSPGPHLAGRHRGGHRSLRMPQWVSIVCAIPQVRQWQRPVRQGGRGAGAAAGARRVK